MYRQHRHEIVLVVTDSVMPAMNGLQLSAVLRESDPQLPVILFSGYPPQERGSDYDNVCERLQKPLTLEQLGQTIKRVLG